MGNPPSENDRAAKIIKQALFEGKLVTVSYEEDSFNDHAYQGTDFDKIWEEVTACGSANVWIKNGDIWEWMSVINEGWVDAEETAADMTANGWLSATDQALDEDDG